MSKPRKKKGNNGARIRTKTPNKTEVNPDIKAMKKAKINEKTKISSFLIFLIFKDKSLLIKNLSVKIINTKLSIPFIIKVGDNDSYIKGL